jgi:hypothetical protein
MGVRRGQILQSTEVAPDFWVGRVPVGGNPLVGGSGGPFLQKEQLSPTVEIPQSVAEASPWEGSVLAGVRRGVFSMLEMGRMAPPRPSPISSSRISLHPTATM